MTEPRAAIAASGNVPGPAIRSARAAAGAALFLTRLPVLAIGAVAVLAIGTIPAPSESATWRVATGEFADLLARWDTFWYNSIATGGYHWDPTVFKHQNIVFFPLYPLLMRWGGWLIGGHALVAGEIVTLLAFTGAVALLYRLAVLDVGEARAWPALLLLSTYPFAIYYSAVYTEALFLFAMAGAFYAMRRDQLFLAALAGLAAGLTRPNGCWLSLSLLFVALRRDDGTEPTRSTARRAAAVIVACAPIGGTILYSAYLFVTYGDALAWVHGQAAWGLPLLMHGSATEPGAGSNLPTSTDILVWTGNIIAFVVAMRAVIPVYRRFGGAYALLIIMNVVPPTLTHLFMSVGRFTAVLFPLFFWFAEVVPRDRIMRLAGVFLAIQLFFAALFFLWLPVV